MSRKAVLRIFAFICALIVLALIIPTFINWNAYKQPLLEQINKYTNFSVAIDGDVKLSLLPRPELRVSQVSVKNDSKIKSEEPFLKLKQLSFALDFLPLLSKKISISSIELIEPIVSMNQQADEKKSTIQSDKSIKKDDKNAENSKAETDNNLAIDIKKASIVNGAVILVDSKTQKRTEIKAINLNGGFSFTQGFDMTASANVDGLPINGALKVGAFVDALPSTLDAQLTLAQEKGIHGVVKLSGVHKDGVFTIKASSNEIKVPMQIPVGVKVIDLAKGIQFNVDSTIHDKLITISAIKAKFTDINLIGKGTFNIEKNSGLLNIGLTSDIVNVSGIVGIDLSQSKPMIIADFALPKVDDKAWTKADKPDANVSTKPQSEAAKQISTERWSKEPIDLSGLQAVNADVSLSIDKLSLNDIDASKVKLRLLLNNGVVTIKQLISSIFDGGLTLTGTLDSKSGQLVADAKLVNVNALKLPSVKGSALKAGTLTASSSITTKVTSMHSLIHHLNGTANLDVNKGVIEGVDIKQFIADLKTTKDVKGLSKLKASFNRKADMAFNHVCGDVKLTNGVAHTRNFEFDMNEGAIKSAGTVDLPNWKLALNSMLTIRDVKNLPSLGINITGSIDQPQFALDMDQLQKALIQLAANQLIGRTRDTVKKKVAEQFGGAIKGDTADKIGGEAAKAIGKILPGLFR